MKHIYWQSKLSEKVFHKAFPKIAQLDKQLDILRSSLDVTIIYHWEHGLWIEHMSFRDGSWTPVPCPDNEVPKAIRTLHLLVGD